MVIQIKQLVHHFGHFLKTLWSTFGALIEHQLVICEDVEIFKNNVFSSNIIFSNMEFLRLINHLTSMC